MIVDHTFFERADFFCYESDMIEIYRNFLILPTGNVSVKLFVAKPHLVDIGLNRHKLNAQNVAETLRLTLDHSVACVLLSVICHCILSKIMYPIVIVHLIRLLPTIVLMKL